MNEFKEFIQENISDFDIMAAEIKGRNYQSLILLKNEAYDLMDIAYRITAITTEGERFQAIARKDGSIEYKELD